MFSSNRSPDSHVALFVDWDNLAISISAEMGGASIDVKALVNKAQQYGIVLIARAYAEWNTMSERLSVYRAGVEPIYAPTFRYETDPNTHLARGKSLADPVMVSDCIDILHVVPQISTFVLVSGDKDLIPVVRLVQLRGKRVVVIGPDLVAAVLRDMADEFVPYRSLVAAEPAPEIVPATRRREQQAPRRPQSRIQVSRQAPASLARPVETTVEAVSEPVSEAAEESEARVAPDLQTTFGAIVEILKEMAASGRGRVRATNLKDRLLVRQPAFSERHCGFSKFKDLLEAAEREGLLSVSAAGPVHWVSLPGVAAEAEPASAEQPPIEEHVRELAVIRFVSQLRARSRWLTYTYVLTNVIGFLGRMQPEMDAESEARSVLNRLIIEGVLRVDRSPQEVDIGGIKHRVRMCHFVDDVPLSREATEFDLSVLPPVSIRELTEGSDQESPSEVSAEVAKAAEADESKAPLEARLTPAGEPSLELGSASSGQRDDAAQAESAEAPAATEAEVASEGEGAAAVDEPAETQAGDSSQDAKAAAPEAKQPAVAAEEPAKAKSSRSRRRPRGGKTRAETEPEAPAAEVNEVPPAAEPEAVAAPAPEAEPAKAATTTDQPEKPDISVVNDTVARILSELAQQGKERVTGSSLKLRLVKALGSFSERDYGFKRFRDFVQQAADSGHASMELEGSVTWVRPAAGESAESGAIEG